jgi:hypothetical protein
MRLVVFSKSLLYLWSLKEIRIATENFGDIFQDFMEFTNRGTLDKVFANLDRCHIVFIYI